MVTRGARRSWRETLQGWTLTFALWQWRGGSRGHGARGGVAGPGPMEHEAQPRPSAPPQLVENEIGDHGKIPPAGGERGVFSPIFMLLN
jgi:hypothetical protein